MKMKNQFQRVIYYSCGLLMFAAVSVFASQKTTEAISCSEIQNIFIDACADAEVKICAENEEHCFRRRPKTKPKSPEDLRSRNRLVFSKPNFEQSNSYKRFLKVESFSDQFSTVSLPVSYPLLN
ncbi:hypothetical protein CHISP_2389 [Chitinispirillum alkaliphilum]|nr:hypothetical protein CHISP_2389 [Chitinispirillum alkaliphilum]